MKRNFGFIPYEGDEKYGFISYKSEDEKLVVGYAKALHDKGVNLWYDYGIPAGQDWYQIISKHIVGASFVIIFVTQRIFKSSVIQTEIQTAEAWGIPVVPIFIEKINLNSIPSEKATFFVQIRNKEGVDEAWKKDKVEVVDSIYELIEPIVISDDERNIKYRNHLLEQKNSVIPDINQHSLVQEALSEIEAEEENFQSEPQVIQKETENKPIEPNAEKTPIQTLPVVNYAAPKSENKSVQPAPIIQESTAAVNTNSGHILNDRGKSEYTVKTIRSIPTKTRNYKPILISAAIVLSVVVMSIIILPNFVNNSTEKDGSSSSPVGSSPRDITLTIGVPGIEEDFVNSVIDDFEKQYAGENDDVNSITINVEKTDFNYSITTDVLAVESASLRALVDTDNLYPVPDNMGDEIKENFGVSTEYVNVEGTYYGYPYTVYPAQLLYYDKDTYTESEVKSLNNILEKGEVGCHNGIYYNAVWWLTAGGELFTNRNTSVCTFDSAECVEMMKFIQKNSSKICIYSIGDSGIAYSLMKEGETSALIGATWYYDAVKEGLGDRLGVTTLPNVTVNNNTYRMKCFGGVNLYAVGASCSEPEAAFALAKYLASEDIQLQRYKLLGVSGIPTIQKLKSNDTIKTDQFALVAMEQMNYTENLESSVIPINWWEDSEQLFLDIYNGTIPEENIQAELTSHVELWKQWASE